MGAPKYIKQILTDIKGEIDSNTIIVGNFNNPSISMNRSTRQKINKEKVALSDTLEQMDLIDNFLQDIPSKKSRIRILFKCICNVSQDS